jgi:LPS O-antigen subunit length determinant protein (WzzB/FepE family)
MRHKNKIIETEEVDLGEIIRKLWKDKFLIICTALIFSVSSYLYISFKPKTFVTTATLRSLPNTLFIKFENELKQNQPQLQLQQPQLETFQLLFTKELQEKLNSFDNISLFVKQNNKITSFKAFLKENKISAKNYFLNGTSKNKFGNVTNGKKIIENQYYLNFPQELKGNEFLDEYIMFTFLKSEKVISSQIISKLSNKKSNYEKHLAVAKKLNLQEPILQQKIQDRSLFMINEPREEYYKGTKVLQSEIDNLDNLIVEAKNLKLDFNPILDRASNPIAISRSPLKFGILGFIMGLFLSLIYIMARNVLKSS